MKKQILLLMIISVIYIISNTIYAQSGWFQQNSGTTFDLKDVQFLNLNTGFAVGNNASGGAGILLRTTDGGTTWTSIYNNPSQLLYATYFNDANTGSITGASPNHIQRTTNGGSSWTTQLNSVPSSILKILYINSSSATAISSSFIYSTTNSGTNWISKLSLNEAGYSDIAFINANTGFVVGSNGVGKTTNGGVNWTSGGAIGSFLGISNLDGLNILCCGYTVSGIKKSTDGGNNFFTVLDGSIFNTIFTSIKYLDINNAVSVGENGKIIKSSNSGINWVQQQSNVTSNLNRVFFVNSLTGWIVGNGGVILKTTTGGVTVGINPITTNIPNAYVLEQNYPNPFNPSTSIAWKLPTSEFVTIKIYDENGKEISTLVNESLRAGEYKINFDGDKLASGIYFYCINAGEFINSKRMVLVK